MVPVADAITKHNTTGGVPLSYDYWSALIFYCMNIDIEHGQ